MPRLRHMNPEKFRFSEQQLQKLRGTHRRLRRLNRTVLRHLRQIWPHFRDQQYRDAGRLLGLEASRINSLLRLCQQIIESDSRQPEAIILTVSYVCPTCVKNEPLEVPESQSADLPEALEADPAWQAEVDWALELVCRTEERVFARCLSRGTLPGDQTTTRIASVHHSGQCLWKSRERNGKPKNPKTNSNNRRSRQKTACLV